jgi:hypothetical protein
MNSFLLSVPSIADCQLPIADFLLPSGLPNLLGHEMIADDLELAIGNWNLEMLLKC